MRKSVFALVAAGDHVGYNSAQSNAATLRKCPERSGSSRPRPLRQGRHQLALDGWALAALLPEVPGRHGQRRRLGLDRGPNHGTWTAAACSLLASCREMIPGSSFLRGLNSADETPGAVNYGTFWSPCDEVINPDGSVVLSGATNTRTGCIGRLSLLVSSSVYTGVRGCVR